MSPVKFSNIVFPVWNFVRRFKFYYKTNAVSRGMYQNPKQRNETTETTETSKIISK